MHSKPIPLKLLRPHGLTGGVLNCVFINLKLFYILKTHLLSNADKPKTTKKDFDSNFIRR